jgi:hypothetical protein
MAEYIQSNTLEEISLNTPITFDSSIPCNRGYVLHENGTGIFTLRGAVNNPSSCFARYQVTFNGNVAIPEGGEVTPIAVALTVQGEVRQSTKAIYTPQAAEEFGNLTSTAIITVPKCCCFTVAVEYVDATTTDPSTEPTPTIEVTNGNLTITRVA